MRYRTNVCDAKLQRSIRPLLLPPTGPSGYRARGREFGVLRRDALCGSSSLNRRCVCDWLEALVPGHDERPRADAARGQALGSKELHPLYSQNFHRALIVNLVLSGSIH